MKKENINTLPTAEDSNNDNKIGDSILEEKSENKVEEKIETISVSKSDFYALVNRLEKVENEAADLRIVADKSRLQKLEDGKKTVGPLEFKISTLNGKLILSTRTVKDIVQKNISSGVYYEHQEYEIIMEDGSKENVIGYNKFIDILYAEQIIGKEISREVTDLNTTLKLKLEDGREIKIDSKFVN